MNEGRPIWGRLARCEAEEVRRAEDTRNPSHPVENFWAIFLH